MELNLLVNGGKSDSLHQSFHLIQMTLMKRVLILLFVMKLNQSFKEAMGLPLADKWRDAYLEEHNWHLENGTWSLVELPPGKEAIGC
jgi:trehalose utilization protein